MTDAAVNFHGGEYSVLRIGLCQVYTEEWQVDANLRRTLEAIEEAAHKGAELAITPECVVHGYGSPQPEGLRARLAEVAEPLDGPNLAQICRKARKCSIEVVVGFVEKGEAGRVHNSAALISSQGEIVEVYRKVHCRPFESAEHQGGFSPGDRFTVSARSYGDRTFRVGTMTCFDREVPESVRCLRSLGAELIACPLATNTTPLGEPTNRANNELITRCRAAENEVFIVVVNHAGRFNGGSFAVGPTGEVYCQLGAGPEVRVVELPVGVVAMKFHHDPFGWMGWGYRRPLVYRPYLER